MTATSYYLGIDLGTTFTAAAVHRNGRTDISPLGNRAAAIPSLVFLRDDETVLTGEAAERRGLAEPARLAREFKRRVGDSVPIMLGQAPYSAERLMAALLKDVVAAVATREGAPPASVAVSHPANWGPFKIDLLHHALDLAGVRAVTLLTEPVAAAMHYASTERIEPGSVVAVYDLGGGTFDAAVLQKTETGFVTLGEPEGIERLGGIDFDEAVMAYVRTALNGKVEELDGRDPTVRAALARLRQECVAAKEALSFDSDTTISVLLPNVQTDIRVTRAEFEPMIRAAISETIEALRRAIERAGARPDDLAAVLLGRRLVADPARRRIGVERARSSGRRRRAPEALDRTRCRHRRRSQRGRGEYGRRTGAHAGGGWRTQCIANECVNDRARSGAAAPPGADASPPPPPPPPAPPLPAPTAPAGSPPPRRRSPVRALLLGSLRRVGGRRRRVPDQREQRREPEHRGVARDHARVHTRDGRGQPDTRVRLHFGVGALRVHHRSRTRR